MNNYARERAAINQEAQQTYTSNPYTESTGNKVGRVELRGQLESLFKQLSDLANYVDVFHQRMLNCDPGEKPSMVMAEHVGPFIPAALQTCNDACYIIDRMRVKLHEIDEAF